MMKRSLKNVWSPQLRNRRDVDVYLPASYPSGARYPVVYIMDGQNLSDPATAFAGTWDLEATIARLASRMKSRMAPCPNQIEGLITPVRPNTDG